MEGKIFRNFLFLVLLTTSWWTCIALEEMSKSFKNHQVWRLVPQNEEHLQELQRLEETNREVTFLLHPGRVGGAVDVVVPPALQKDLSDKLMKMPNSVLTENLESMIERESMERKSVSIEGAETTDIDFNRYLTLSEIQGFMSDTAKLNPDICEHIVYGQTSEGRDLTMVLVKKPSTDGSVKPVMLIDANMHAREWITSAVCIYFMNEVLNGNQLEYKELLERTDIMFACMCNPDGFAYSQSTHRLWRKNRVPTSDMACMGNLLEELMLELQCFRVDPNRNYNFGHQGEGSSTNPCSDIYCGPSPFSEAETSNLTNFVQNYLLRTKSVLGCYTSLHSYSQMILCSYGCNQKITPNPTADRDLDVANNAAEQLKSVHGTQYTCGNSETTLYPACGTSADWFKFNCANFAYTYELRDQGRFGFLLPADQILPSCRETSRALLMMHLNVLNSLSKG